MTTFKRFVSHLRLSQQNVSTGDCSHINYTFYAQNASYISTVRIQLILTKGATSVLQWTFRTLRCVC